MPGKESLSTTPMGQAEAVITTPRRRMEARSSQAAAAACITITGPRSSLAQELRAASSKCGSIVYGIRSLPHGASEPVPKKVGDVNNSWRRRLGTDKLSADWLALLPLDGSLASTLTLMTKSTALFAHAVGLGEQTTNNTSQTTQQTANDDNNNTNNSNDDDDTTNNINSNSDDDDRPTWLTPSRACIHSPNMGTTCP